MDDRLQRAPVGAIETTTDGRIIDVNETAATTIGSSPDRLRETNICEVFPKSAVGTLRDAFDAGSVTAQSFEEYYPQIDRWLAIEIQIDETVLVYIRDQTGQREAERSVEQLQQRLERVQQIDALVVTVLQRVLGASDRVDVGQTICEGLSGTDRYRFSWVGDRTIPDDRLQVLAAEGSAPELLDEIEATLGDETTLPGQEALTTGDTQLVEAIAEAETIPRDIRRAAFSHGLQSCLAVPLEYQGTIYGVVSVYSGQEDGFSEQERAGLETLGSVAGFAIKAIRQEDLLVADTVTEVTISVRDESVPFVRAARDLDTQLSLDGAVPRGDGAVVCYLSMGDHCEGINDILNGDGEIADVRWVRSEQDPLLQVTVTGETPVTTLAGWGATVTGAEYTGESAQLTAEVPPEGDVRRLVETVDATVTETALVAKEETTQSPDPVDAFRDALGDRLTDKQRTVLRTAYLSDYFSSPRGSTSEEVAETLDIAGSTMLYHLRRAQAKLVEAFFAPDAETPTTTES
jgi:predicted DNA binding protein/putative methionine-R-sulfoxide reductase with GAF domain